MDAQDPDRKLGLFRATLVGVGAIVGGGVLALAGTAFASAGLAAILAFVLNGVIAFATARSFAVMTRAYPQSGGSYVFAKMILSARSAFAVGWMVWFAGIVAGVLYALGFAVYALIIAREAFILAGVKPPAWLGFNTTVLALAGCAVCFYTLLLLRRAAGGGMLESVGKVVVFLMIVGFGVWAALFADTPDPQPSPFFHGGAAGLLEAMGFTFIAVQGFGLIPAVSGEIREARRTVPRAMYLSLAVALLIYIPLLLVVALAGISEGESVVSMGERHRDDLIVVAARNFLGAPGFWLVAVAALLSMLSALQANLFVASRIARTMAQDRMLPWELARLNPERGIPTGGVLASAALLLVILPVMSDVASAGAAAGLIFLVTYALVQWTEFLARRRGTVEGRRRLNVLPVLGGLACLGLAVFQGVVVPQAGVITVVWMAIGVGIYVTLFARRAEALDAADVARNPMRSQARGENPLVLLPIANPASAQALVSVAHALTPPLVGRVLLLFVIRKPDPAGAAGALEVTQEVLAQTLAASFGRELYPEALTTVASDPWAEIARVARTRDCQSLLLGMSKLSETEQSQHLEQLMSSVDADVVVLRARPEWQVASAKTILVPVGGGGAQDELRARMLGSLSRDARLEVIYLRVIDTDVPDLEAQKIEQELERVALSEAPGFGRVRIIRSNSGVEQVAKQCEQADLTIIGVQRIGKRKKLVGRFAMQIVHKTTQAVMLISRRG